MESNRDSPPRPLVPPKPDKDKISFSTNSSSQTQSTSPASVHTLGKLFSGENSFNCSKIRIPATNGHQSEIPRPYKPPLTAPKPFSPETSPHSQKPALPPKPSNSSSSSRLSTTSPLSSLSPLDSSGPTTCKISPPLLPKGRNSISIANAILANKANNSARNSFSTEANTRPFSTRSNKDAFSDTEFSKSSITPTRRHPDIRSPSAPISPHPFPPTPIASRPSSTVFHFPNSAQDSNFNSRNQKDHTHNNSLLPKSFSLGRNVAPPTSPTSVSQFFSSRASTLAKMLPLDLSFKRSQIPTTNANTTQSNNKSKSINLPPTTTTTTTMMMNSSHNMNMNNSMGKVTFSTNSPIPPPPPPRKKKLSPLNSLSPVSDSSPSSPPPVFSPTPTSTPLDLDTAIYAEVDKDKKWADRRRKEGFSSVKVNAKVEENAGHSAEDGIQVSLVITINRDTTDSKTVTVQSDANLVPESKDYETETQNRFSLMETSQIKPPSSSTCSSANTNGEKSSTDLESRIQDSWLGKYLKSSVQSEIFPPPRPQAEEDNEEVNRDKAAEDGSTLNRSDADLPPLIENKSFLFSALSTVGGNCGEQAEKQDESCTMDEIGNFSSMTISNTATDAAAESQEPEHNVIENELESESLPPKYPDSLLQSVDDKIQSAVNRLSNLSGKSSPSQQRVETPPPIQEQFESLSITENGLDNKVEGKSVTLLPSAISDTALPDSQHICTTTTTTSIVRRRSWNCSVDRESSSPCESSSSSFTNLRDKLKDNLGWVDEGDSTGVLGDIDTSDAQPPHSSTEDFSENISKRNRKKNSGSGWFFSSLSRKSASSTTTSGSNGKEKSSSNKKKGKINGRNSVSAIMISKPVISGPLPNSTETPPQQTTQEFEQLLREKSHSHPTVQFSPDVLDSPVHPRQRYSEGSIGDTADNYSLPPESEKGDDESICSFSSASTTGTGYNLNLSGFEDILADLSPKEKKAFYVAREIFTSEQTFVDVLHLLTVEFPNHIRSADDANIQAFKQSIISERELNEILNSLPNLKQVNIELKQDLESRIINWRENPKLADVIVMKGPFLKLYSEYIKNHQKITQKLREHCLQNPAFRKAVSEFEMSERCQKLALNHYMLKPVQRMPQYSMLLGEYLKCLEEDGCDYTDTVKALAIVKDVAEHANEAIRLQVNAEKLLQLQNRLTGAIIMKADRQLLKEGELTKVCRKDLQQRFFALMNDVFLYMSYNATTGSLKDLKMRNELPLAGMRVELSETGDYPNEFSVISTARSFNLVAKSPKERDEWMKALNDAIHDNIRKRSIRTPDQENGFQLGKIAPVWIQDSRVTMCQICTAEFRVTFRRHHCRSCGKVVCGNCSGNQAPLQYLKNDAARVCDECYQHLLEEFDKESRESTNEGLETSRDTIRNRFKKVTPNITKSAGKLKKHVPSRLEVHANNSGSRISGYLHLKERKAWKRQWFVLMDRVLYIYAAPEDIVAIRSIPVLGWNVEFEKSECMDGGDADAVFKLMHTGQNTLLFQVDNPTLAERWVSAMKEATVLS